MSNNINLYCEIIKSLIKLILIEIYRFNIPFIIPNIYYVQHFIIIFPTIQSCLLSKASREKLDCPDSCAKRVLLIVFGKEEESFG